MDIEEEPDFLVSINFTPSARAWLGLQRGPTTKYRLPEGLDLATLKLVLQGDFLRIEGIEGLWVVSHRVWHLMGDQTALKFVLDGPIGEDE